MITEQLLDILKLCVDGLSDTQLRQMVKILLSIHEDHKPIENWEEGVLTALNVIENAENKDEK